MRCKSAVSAGLALAIATVPTPGQELEQPDSRFDVGVRGVIVLGQGQPANDMIGESLVGRWRVRDPWYLGLALTSVTFDYETPNRVLGIASATVVDGSNEFSRTSVFVERRYETERVWDWYWTAGVGVASVDAVANVAGTRVGGGTFNIATAADHETHVFAGGGLRRPLGEHWTLETAFTFEHHGTDYRLVDLVSGTRGSLGAHSPYGLAAGVSYSF